MTDTVVSAIGLSKRYKLYNRPLDRIKEVLSISGRNHHKEFWALRNVSLRIAPGESYGVIGRNGAGKSTLLKVIAGVTRPSNGQAHVSGRVGALLELGTGFHPDYTGRENIYFATAMVGLEEQETDAIVPEIISFTELDEFIDQPVKTYSSGMFMRLGFAVAMSAKPDILITDEVLAVGDEAFQKKCIRRMEQFLQDGRTLIFCSHSMYHVRKLCGKAVWLDKGEIRASGGAVSVTHAFEDYLRGLDNNAFTSADESRSAPALAGYSVLQTVRLLNARNEEGSVFDMGDVARLEIVAETPDDSEPVIAVGCVRNDNTAIYGIFSDIDAVRPKRIRRGSYRIVYEVYDLSLLPGTYTFRAHVLDTSGLRMFDTVEKEFTVRGNTREIGICRLPHRWIS